MKALFAMCILLVLTGCVTSVNVIVAPHAGLTVDSFKDGGGTNDTIIRSDVYSDLYTDEGEYEVLPQAQVL